MNYLKVLLQKALNRQNIPGLIMALHDREPAVRSSAAVALGKTGRIGLEALIEALADTEAGVRASVASSLAQIGDAQAIEPLIVAFRAEERSSQARRAMLLALGRLRRPNSLAVLSEVITSKNDPLWEDAAELLVETREKAAVPALLSILEDSNYSHWHYQVAAARVLGDIRDMAAAGPLAKALENHNPHVAIAAFEAFNKLPGSDKSSINVQAITHSIAAEILQLHSRTIYAVVGTGEVIGRSATGESYEQIYDFVPAPDIDGIRALIAIIPAQLRQQVRMLCSELDGYF